jgi:hypothetical protein
MANLYASPSSEIPNPESTSTSTNSNRRRWYLSLAFGITIVAMSLLSLALITQALRLESESTTLPARLRAEYAATARSSWIGGISAVAGVVLNLFGLVLVRKNKLYAPIALLVLSVLGMIAIAILFKPS